MSGVMKARIQALFEKMPQSAPCNNFIYFPVQDFCIYGIFLEASSSGVIYVWRLFIPLCVPSPRFTLTFSQRVQTAFSADLSPQNFADHVSSDPVIKNWVESLSTLRGRWYEICAGFDFQDALNWPNISLACGVLNFLDGKCSVGMNLIKNAEFLSGERERWRWVAESAQRFVSAPSADSFKGIAEGYKKANLEMLDKKPFEA